MNKKYELITSRIPIMTPIAFIWDLDEGECRYKSYGIIIACYIIAIKINL